MYIINFCRRRASWPAGLIALAASWLLAGLAWLWPGLLIYLHGAAANLGLVKFYSLLSFHAAALFALPFIYFMVKEISRRALLARRAAYLTAGAVLLYSYFLIFLPWGEPVYSAWGLEVRPPRLTFIMSLVMLGVFALLTLIALTVRRSRGEAWLYLAFLIYFLALAVDVSINSSWWMVLDRLFMFSASLIAFSALHLGPYLAQSQNTNR